MDRCYSKEQTWQNKRSVTSNTGNISYTGLQIMLCGSLSCSCLDHCSLTDLNTHQASRFHLIYDNSRNMVTYIISIWRHHQTHTHNNATTPSRPPRKFPGELLSAFFVFTRAHSALNILTTTITSTSKLRTCHHLFNALILLRKQHHPSSFLREPQFF